MYSSENRLRVLLPTRIIRVASDRKIVKCTLYNYCRTVYFISTSINIIIVH